MQTAIYLISAVLLLIAAHFVFNRIVAQAYLNKGKLGWLALTIQFPDRAEHHPEDGRVCRSR